jgi:hypothetical protein
VHENATGCRAELAVVGIGNCNVAGGWPGCGPYKSFATSIFVFGRRTLVKQISHFFNWLAPAKAKRAAATGGKNLKLQIIRKNKSISTAMPVFRNMWSNRIGGCKPKLEILFYKWKLVWSQSPRTQWSIFLGTGMLWCFH